MRNSIKERKTKETEINASVNLDGSGLSKISTNIGFFDHMLTSFTKHSLFDLDLNVIGDLNVDTHHTVEDTGIVLGKAILEALGDKSGINRYASYTIAMDEALVLCAIDLSGRGYFQMDYEFGNPKCGDFETETTEEFFRAFALNLEANLHFLVIRGQNSHHIIEAMFKALGRSIREAVTVNPRITGVFSTKGTL